MEAPSTIRVRKKKRVLELSYAALQSPVDLSFEYLRVYSPSAEVMGHGRRPGPLQSGKKNVVITLVEPAGHYGLRLVFDDGHSSGIYTWDWLWELGSCQVQLWQAYLDRLAAAGACRDPDTAPVRIMEPRNARDDSL
ncbi:MAG: DUF971 domain-containing protein [Kistimonas sp.]|nr:DUF971 domain-containing protein [Kistimonas sp.]